MVDGYGLRDPDYERRLWAEVDSYQRRNAQRKASASPDTARRAADLSRAYPWESPGVIVGQANAGITPGTPAAAAVADASAEAAAKQGWGDALLDGAFDALKATVRTGFLAAETAFQDVIERPFRAALYARDSSAPDHNYDPIRRFRRFGDALSRLPGSRAGMAVEDLFQGEPVDVGSGFLPGGEITAERARQQAQVTFADTGMPTSPGDLFAGKITQPGTDAYNNWKAAINTGFELGTDPLNFIGGAANATRIGGRLFTSTRTGTQAGADLAKFGLVNAHRRAVLPETVVDGWLHSTKQGARLREWAMQTDDFETIRSRGFDAETSMALQDATTVSEVDDVLVGVLGKRNAVVPTAPAGFRFNRRVDDVEIIRRSNADGGFRNRYFRLGQQTPGNNINLEDVDEAVETLTRWQANAMVPKAKISANNRAMAEAIVANEPERAWRVFTEQVQGDIATELRRFGNDEEVVRDLTRVVGGQDFANGWGSRGYWANQSTGLPAMFESSRSMLVNDVEQALPTPFWFSEYANRSIPLQDARDIRRATSQLSRLNSVPGGVGAQNAINKTTDILWWGQRTLITPLWLVTRVAWPVRIVGEEQVRMSAAGLHSMLNHPIDYWALAIGRKGGPRIPFTETTVGEAVTAASGAVGVKPRKAVDVHGELLEAAEQFQRAQVGNVKAFRDEIPAQVKTGDWGSVAKGAADRETYLRAWGIEMGKAWSDDMAQTVASNMLDGDNNLTAAKEWYWSGPGRKMRERMIASGGESAQPLATRAGADRKIEEARLRLQDATGSDGELLESIATRELRGAAMRDVRPDRNLIRSVLTEKKQSYGPEFLYGPKSMQASQSEKALAPLKAAESFLWRALGAVPSNVLSRSPVYRQLYWRRMTELMEWGDDTVAGQILDAAGQANFKKGELRALQERAAEVSRARGPVPALPEQPSGVREVWQQTFDEFGAAAAQRRGLPLVKLADPQPAGPGLPPLFHGTSRAFEGDRLMEHGGASAGNLYGPGFYTTDAEDVARSYRRKGRRRGSTVDDSTVYEVRWTGDEAPRMFDLEQTMPDDVRGAVSRWVDEFEESSDYALEDMERLRAMLDAPDTATAGLYRQIKELIAGGGDVPMSEADEIIDSFNDLFRSQGFDGFTHRGGLGGREHGVRIFFDQSKVDLSRRAAASDAPVDATPSAVDIDDHRALIEQAIADGKPVPGDVLADYPDLYKTVAGNRLIRDLDEADQLAKAYALNEANGLLYNLHEKGQFADAYRLIFPFAEAFKEIMLTWTKLVGRNPMVARRGQVLIEGARDGGFFYPDPATGQERFGFPGGALLTRMLWGADEGDVRAAPAGFVSGVNLAATGVMPGFGPFVQWPAGKFLPDRPEWDAVREQVLPFGADQINSPGDLVDSVMPAYIKKVLTGVTEGGFDENLWNSTVAEAMRANVATGDYTSDAAGIEELEAASVEDARRIILWRAVAQAIGPTGPSVGVEVRSQGDFAFAPDDLALFDGLAGTQVTPNDAAWFQTTVYAGAWYKLQQQLGDSFAATEEFQRLFGFDPYLITAGKTTSSGERARTEPGVAWERAHPELVEDYDLTVGYYAPDSDGRVDFTSFFRRIAEGDATYLTPEQFVLLANNTAAWSIYQHQAAKVEGRNDPGARRFKAEWRAYLQETFPGFNTTIVGVPQEATQDQYIAEFEKAAGDPRILDTKAGAALGGYMARREQAIEQLMADPAVVSREQAVGRLQSANVAAGLRSWLREWGRTYTAETPEFIPIWESRLSREVQEGDDDGDAQ